MILPMILRGCNKSTLQYRKLANNGYNISRKITTNFIRYASGANASRHAGTRNTVNFWKIFIYDLVEN